MGSDLQRVQTSRPDSDSKLGAVVGGVGLFSKGFIITPPLLFLTFYKGKRENVQIIVNFKVRMTM